MMFLGARFNADEEVNVESFELGIDRVADAGLVR